jgi:hypothetical protein
MIACALGGQKDESQRWGVSMILLSALGAAVLVLTVVAFITGSLTVLLLLVADFVVRWAGSTVRHLFSGQPKAAEA